MRVISEDRKKQILDSIDAFYDENGTSPTVREIAERTGLPATTVHRYLNRMDETGEMEYGSGRRTSSTKRVKMEVPQHAMPVLGYVSCGPGQEEQEQIIEYIRMPESLIGKGEFFALIAKGESMLEAGIRPGDCVIVRKQSHAEPGNLVVALYEGLNNLKKLVFENGEYLLRSCNPNRELYADIRPGDLEIQGVAVGVYHGF